MEIASSSFRPPTADDPVPSEYPSWVLLDKIVYFAHQENAPGNKVKTSTGKEIEISICLANPPAVSYFCVHSPEIHIDDYSFHPHVVCSAENLVLLSFTFRAVRRSNPDYDPDLVDFFVCKAGSGGVLSIDPVPCSPTGTNHLCDAGIVPRGGGNFLVADLSLSPREDDLSPREDFTGLYYLQVFSSETRKWTSMHLQLPMPAGALSRDLPRHMDKVISLGGSVLGWVDLCHGIVLCDILEEKHVLRFIPLPRTVYKSDVQPQKVRDVTCCNGFISFVEFEQCFRERTITNRRSYKMTQNLDTENVIIDKACFIPGKLDNKPELVRDGWKINTMFKNISWDYWKKKDTIHVDDISAVPEHSVLPQLWNSEAMKYTLRNLESTDFLFFSVYDDRVIYLICDVQSDAEESWIVGFDLEEKKLEVIKLDCATSARCFNETVLPCAFSGYLNAETSGSSYGAHSGSGNYPQPTELHPQEELPPNLPPTVQPMSSLTQSGYVYAHWTVPDSNGRMVISVPLDDMKRPVAAPSVLLTPPVLSSNCIGMHGAEHDLDQLHPSRSAHEP